MVQGVVCPSCQAPQPDPPTSRFCDACGLALPVRRRAATEKIAEGAEPVRCPECGVPAVALRCRACGSRVRWPEGQDPPE